MRHFLSYLAPMKVAEYSSFYNRHIRINEENGRYSLLVNGSNQSGKYIEWLWNNAFRAFHITDDISIRSIAVLGIAGGTVIHMLHTLYPKAKITGVDIDPMMITIGNTYFYLRDISEFIAIAMDAKKFVSPLLSQSKTYDCVIVDMSFGRLLPEFLETKEFWKNIRRIMSPKGYLIVNYLQEKEYQMKSNIIGSLLKEIGTDVKDFRIKRNRFFFASIV